ncbi:MAG: hypothetical protein VB111_10760 [Clostridiaceae bacterium]|nr:hypothetical protein [Clostridiaceae bacterium]
MLSCTEFIPFYSELFSYIEEKSDHDGVVRYWNHISDTYVEERLGECVRKEGMRGMWTYWSRSLAEEAADFVMTYDEEREALTIDMRYCPSRGLLNSLTYMKPYHDYCGHCGVLYDRVLEKFGVESRMDFSKVSEAKCWECRQKRTDLQPTIGDNNITPDNL